MVTTRKRRVIEEDDGDGDGNCGEGSTVTNDPEQQLEREVEGGEKKAVATSVVDRLKRRAAKSAEVAQQKIKRKKSQTESNEVNKSPNKPSAEGRSTMTEQSIPKKPRKTQTIPKKSIDDKNGTKNELDNGKKETPSLLSEMKKPPISKTSQGKSSVGKANPNINKKKPRPFHSSWGTAQTPGSPSGVPLANMASTTLPPTSTNFVDLSEPTIIAQVPIVSIVAKIEEVNADKFGSGLRQLALDGIRDLCKDMFQIPPERNGVDLFASFLRCKDLKMAMLPNGKIIDTNDTVGVTKNLQYDFFDVDEKTGATMHQPKIPIFPEEFARAGTQEWPLSWWGIVDPAMSKENNANKAKSQIDGDTDRRPMTRRGQSCMRPDTGKDNSGDRKRHDNHRYSRKRSSRDIYENEHAYYDGYPSREDCRDRFLPGVYDNAGDGYPPDTDYDHDYNESLPNGYHPDSRKLYHRDSVGCQPYSHRSRDAPLPPAPPYPRDAATPGNFRGGDRQYPIHGSSGYREYRDTYDPQGRSALPLRDDRQENRDRSQRSPHSKLERDNRQYSVRKSSSGSSNRNERNRMTR